MKSSSIPHGLALAAVLALSSSGAFAGSSEPRALSDAEMSSVYGRGLSDPTLAALGALTPQEQSGSNASSADALAALTGDGAQTLDRLLTQQRLQAAASGVQATVKLAENLAALDKSLAPIANAVTLPMMTLPLFGLPALANLAALANKHG